jgi:hypothetical protein
VDRGKLPEAQFPDPPVSAFKEVHWNWTAPTGTDGQPARVDDGACTVNDQLPFPFPDIVQVIVAALLPLTGVTSGLGEENVIVGGAMESPVIVDAASAALTRIVLMNARRGTITEDR